MEPTLPRATPLFIFNMPRAEDFLNTPDSALDIKNNNVVWPKVKREDRLPRSIDSQPGILRRLFCLSAGTAITAGFLGLAAFAEHPDYGGRALALWKNLNLQTQDWVP